MKRTIAVLLAALVALTLAGCGSKSLAGEKASTLLTKAQKAVKAEKYVSISGKIKESGTTTSIDLHYVDDDSYGTIVLAGAKMQIESVDGKTWVKLSKAFWEQQLSKAQAKLVTGLIGDRWIIADPKNSNFKQLIQLSSRSFVTDGILKPDSKPTKGKVTTVNGHKVIPLTVDSGKLYLDETTAKPVQVSGSGSDNAASADFSYDKVDKPSAPAADQQADLTKLMSGKS